MTEQTEIAKILGISNNALRSIVHEAKLKFELINNKRHYELKEVLDAIKKEAKRVS